MSVAICHDDVEAIAGQLKAMVYPAERDGS